MSADNAARLRLLRTPGVGPVTWRQLLARFGSAPAAIDALPQLARRGGGEAPRVPDAAQAERELATLGHPLADLAYNCLPWRLPVALDGLVGAAAPGLPSEAEYVAAYCRHAGRAGVPELDFFVVFSLFRWAAIAAGVYRRALDGNAADARALDIGTKFRALADAGWEIAQRM